MIAPRCWKTRNKPTHPIPPGDSNLLIGGGEMGELMRRFDWSDTPVGDATTWPDSLRISLSILLGSGYPMYIAWGPAYVQFYNDAYRPILGSVKHPALGKSSRETFSEIWDIIGTMFDAVLQSGTPSTFVDMVMPMDRNGFLEECSFTFSYSPIRSSRGSIDGVLVTVLETTDRILRERREATRARIAATSGHTTMASVAGTVADICFANPHDLPFFALLAQAEGESSPLVLSEARTPDSVLLQLTESNVSGFDARELATIPLKQPTPSGVWPEPVATMILVPVQIPGRADSRLHIAVGKSPRLNLDKDYLQFLSGLAAAVAQVFAETMAYETERKRIEALAALDRAKTAFFSNVSHEFRTPLTLMLGPLQELRERESGFDARDKETLDVIHRNALRMRKLVNNLLDYSSIEAGKLRAQFVETDLAALTSELASVFRSSIEKGGLRFSVTCEAVGNVYVDHGLWERIILNLLSNALKFTFEGSIEVALRKHGGAAELIVRDTGCGVSSAELPRIFERFHRSKESRSRTNEGTGIGLSLVRELVQLHGGTIDVASELNRGTCFTVRIPFGRDHLPAEQIQQEGNAARLSGSTSDLLMEEAFGLAASQMTPESPDLSVAHPSLAARSGKAGRILVADDNADMRRYVMRLLSNYWEVETVANGLEAIEAISLQSPDVVITDVMMPLCDGFELLARLRADPQTQSTPVIMLSARAGEESRIEGLNAGADDYLVKPFSARELVARVETQFMRLSLRRTEYERLQRLFNQSPGFVAIVRGPTHVFELQNEGYEALIGHRSVIGQTVAAALPEAIEQGFVKLLDEVFHSGVPFIGTAMAFKIQRKRDGPVEELYVDFVYQPIFNELQQVTGIMAQGYDVTEQHRSRQEQQIAAQQKDQFIATLAHELRNPLAPIRAASSLLQSRNLAPATIEKSAQIVGRQVEHMAKLLDDLLDVASIARNQIRLVKERVRIDAVVAMAIEAARPLIDEKKHELVVGHDCVIEIEADRVRMAQVITNLLLNAAKYTEPGGSIAIRSRVDDGQCQITVSDNGVGIPPQELGLVFDMFAQAPRTLAHSAGGLGIGLGLAKGLVLLHGGSVHAHSEGPGLGSVFTVRLPSLAPARPVQAAHSPGRLQRPVVPKTILVADDNADFKESLSIYLEMMGHRILLTSR